MKLSTSSRFKSAARVSLLVAELALAGPAWDMLKNIFAGSGEAGAAGLATVTSASDGTMLEELARPQEGRSMRATSTMRMGEIRRGPNGERNTGERKYNPRADPRGDDNEQSNWDNFNIPPGETHVLLDAQGPGVITHMWITFLGPEPQDWAPQGSANHQELMLRMY
jgi:hypothetical protein